MEELVRQYKNARAVIKQIKDGEWEFQWSQRSRQVYTATRDGYELWVANGPFFLDAKDPDGSEQNAFGFIFGHWVWFAAVRKAKKEAVRKFKREHDVRFYK
ncbi:hypothetical protein [Candidatus Sororendozoicomonas aggregata]|uniref:hypothetical protein n=1 Tax=Candidatus Sororendozoicomonas aggregata TaxID=3073239 RepID=UPI002ED1DED0